MSDRIPALSDALASLAAGMPPNTELEMPCCQDVACFCHAGFGSYRACQCERCTGPFRVNQFGTEGVYYDPVMEETCDWAGGSS